MNTASRIRVSDDLKCKIRLLNIPCRGKLQFSRFAIALIPLARTSAASWLADSRVRWRSSTNERVRREETEPRRSQLTSWRCVTRAARIHWKRAPFPRVRKQRRIAADRKWIVRRTALASERHAIGNPVARWLRTSVRLWRSSDKGATRDGARKLLCRGLFLHSESLYFCVQRDPKNSLRRRRRWRRRAMYFPRADDVQGIWVLRLPRLWVVSADSSPGPEPRFAHPRGWTPRARWSTGPSSRWSSGFITRRGTEWRSHFTACWTTSPTPTSIT